MHFGNPKCARTMAANIGMEFFPQKYTFERNEEKENEKNV